MAAKINFWGEKKKWQSPPPPLISFFGTCVTFIGCERMASHISPNPHPKLAALGTFVMYSNFMHTQKVVLDDCIACPSLHDLATTNVSKVDVSNRNHIESRWMKWLKQHPLIWIHYESGLGPPPPNSCWRNLTYPKNTPYLRSFFFLLRNFCKKLRNCHKKSS